ncbi:MAG: prolipoprotein diacylglyceryl transferase [Candidatus Riflebacteria bacterium]|nr:prolipoprotein diacylglyceryl transferase [Candidatus Riflebacteria bacterium]
MYPILFSTPWFNVYSYGLLIALGYTLGTVLILREARRDGLDANAIFDMLLLQLIVGICGSRLLFVLEYTPEKLNFRDFFAFEQGGLTFYGAVISSIIFDLLYLKYRKMPFWRVIDCVGYGLPAGIALARIGCLLNGCCYGTSCSLPWAIRFANAGTGTYHPTQLYESLGALAIWYLLYRLRQWRRNYGEIFLACMASYGLLRFFIEFVRAENPVVVLGMTMAQIIGLLMIAAAFVAWKKIAASRSQRILPDQSPVELAIKS